MSFIKRIVRFNDIFSTSRITPKYKRLTLQTETLNELLCHNRIASANHEDGRQVMWPWRQCTQMKAASISGEHASWSASEMQLIFHFRQIILTLAAEAGRRSEMYQQSRSITAAKRTVLTRLRRDAETHVEMER